MATSGGPSGKHHEELQVRPKPDIPNPIMTLSTWPPLYSWEPKADGYTQIGTKNLGILRISRDAQTKMLNLRPHPYRNPAGEQVTTGPAGPLPITGKLLAVEKDLDQGYKETGQFSDGRNLLVGSFRAYKVRCDDNEILLSCPGKDHRGNSSGFMKTNLTGGSRSSAFVGYDLSGFPAWVTLNMNGPPSGKVVGSAPNQVTVKTSIERRNLLQKHQKDTPDSAIRSTLTSFASSSGASIKQMMVIPHYNLTPAGNFRAILDTIGRHGIMDKSPFFSERRIVIGNKQPVEDRTPPLYTEAVYPCHSLRNTLNAELKEQKKAFVRGRPITPFTRITPLDSPTRNVKGTYFATDKEHFGLINADLSSFPKSLNPDLQEMLPEAKLTTLNSGFLLGDMGFQLPVPLLSCLELHPTMVTAVATWLARPEVRDFGVTFHGAIVGSFVWLKMYQDRYYCTERQVWMRLRPAERQEAEDAADADAASGSGWKRTRTICGIETPSLTNTMLTMDAYLRYGVENRMTA